MKRSDIKFVTPADWRGLAIRMGLLLAFVFLTNSGFTERFRLLVEAHRYGTLVPWLLIWGFSLVALLVAALQPSRLVRAFWAVVLSLSTAAGVGFARVSGSDMSVFDVLTLWNARHETSRAFEFYHNDVLLTAAVFLIGFVLLMAPPAPLAGWPRRLMRWLGWLPTVPVAVIAAIVFIKAGGGSQVMPRQFQTLALGVVAATKVATTTIAPRHALAIEPAASPAVRDIVLLVDESVRGDYIDWRPGNPYTPHLAAERGRFVDFGHAVSGGNCSNISNAILRLGASRADLVASVNTSPSIWQYAKRAGYRTVFIDGQSGFIKNPGKLQNFMTMSEVADIDEFITFDGEVAMADLDNRVLDEIAKRLGGDKPVFIYANKNGAHFPYDEGYPAAEARFHPTVAESGDRSAPARINSYRNVIRWSVDGFFARLFAAIDLSDTLVLYTSDHGQNFADGRMTHCSTEHPDPREGLVPLMALTADAGLKARFAEGAALNRGRASHFAITPTLLDLMGYAPAEVRTAYGSSLFEAAEDRPAFTAGDIFGLFGDGVMWTPIDPNVSYREPFADPGAVTGGLDTVELKDTSRPIN